MRARLLDWVSMAWFFFAMLALMWPIAISMIGVQPAWEAVIVACWLLLFLGVLHRFDVAHGRVCVRDLALRILAPFLVYGLVQIGYELPSAA